MRERGVARAFAAEFAAEDDQLVDFYGYRFERYLQVGVGEAGFRFAKAGDC